jgi:hypothetical protein
MTSETKNTPVDIYCFGYDRVLFDEDTPYWNSLYKGVKHLIKNEHKKGRIMAVFSTRENNDIVGAAVLQVLEENEIYECFNGVSIGKGKQGECIVGHLIERIASYCDSIGITVGTTHIFNNEEYPEFKQYQRPYKFYFTDRQCGLSEYDLWEADGSVRTSSNRTVVVNENPTRPEHSEAEEKGDQNHSGICQPTTANQ